MASQSKTSTANSGSSQSQSSNNPKLSQFHPKNIESQEKSSSNINLPPLVNIQKKSSSADEDGANQTSQSPSNPDKASKTQGRWTKEEHVKFIDGLKKYGRNWKKVEEHIGTRTGAQIRSHAQKFFNRLEKEQQNNSEVSEQSKELLEIMNNSTHANANSLSLTKACSVDSSLVSIQQEKGKKSNSIKKKNSLQNTPNQSAQNPTQSPSISNYGAVNSNYDQLNLNYDPQNSNNEEQESNDDDNQQIVLGLQGARSSNQNGLLNQNGLINQNGLLGSNKVDKQNLIYKKTQDQEIFLKSHASRKFSEEYNIDYLKVQDESNDTTDYNQMGSYSQLKVACELPKQNPSQSPHHPYYPSKFGGQQINQSAVYNKFDSPVYYHNYFNNSVNNYHNQSNQFYNQNSNGYASNNGSHYSYQQKGLYDERDFKSEEGLEKYLRQQDTQDNSFFRENNLGELDQPKLYDLCEIVQQNQNSGQLNYQSESYVPNFKKGGRSRFGSFKLYDEENESSNQKYQNFRKQSIDDQELKKKLKLNDKSSFIPKSNKVSPDSQVLN